MDAPDLIVGERGFMSSESVVEPRREIGHDRIAEARACADEPGVFWIGGRGAPVRPIGGVAEQKEDQRVGFVPEKRGGRRPDLEVRDRRVVG